MIRVVEQKPYYRQQNMGDQDFIDEQTKKRVETLIKDFSLDDLASLGE